ncbi:hypothetical protein C468_00400 [Halorubrum kocurii JCM 14978]|uniref:Uncharacterized protein n=1 Tax=Halorubrum kocurii JCM 14978 TaxID=1230456 RepID=M0PK48_9EURY|nr:hypothetical protein C468_00400 [Halorubrum kocurii JCM 14978]
MLHSGIEDGEWVRIEKHRTIPIDGCVFVVELDVAGAKIRIVGILMEVKHEVPLRFDLVDAIVFVVDTGRVPKSDFQSCGLSVGIITQERCRREIHARRFSC